MAAAESISFDRIADRYDESRGGEGRGQVMATEIEPYLAGASRVVEIGVGTGVVAAGLARLGHNVVGVDISADMLSRAHARLGARVARADGRSLPLRTDSIDAVYLVWVLHLVGDPSAVVAECARVLRPSGRLVVVAGLVHTEPNDMAEHERRLDALRKRRPDTAESVSTWASASDLVLVDQRQLQETFEHSPADHADALEQRAASFLWDLDTATWAEVVQPVIDGLRGLLDPTRARRVVQYRDFLVFSR